jgi:hypothetical protein
MMLLKKNIFYSLQKNYISNKHINCVVPVYLLNVWLHMFEDS